MSDSIDSAMCCRNLEGLIGALSPFSRFIAFDFYDGPTGGIVQCKTCLTAYRITMVDWDEHQEVRVFAIAELPSSSFQNIVEMLAPYDSPRWPVWVPKWQFASEDTRMEYDGRVREILASAGAPRFIVALSRYGERVLVAKPVGQQYLKDIQDWFSPADRTHHRDWFSFLGLTRGPI